MAAYSSASAPLSAHASETAARRAGKSSELLLILQMVAGAGSGAACKTATAPLERIKIIFQVQGMKGQDLIKPKYTGILQTIWCAWAHARESERERVRERECVRER